jgi:hypothetical protein
MFGLNVWWLLVCVRAQMMDVYVRACTCMCREVCIMYDLCVCKLRAVGLSHSNHR